MIKFIYSIGMMVVIIATTATSAFSQTSNNYCQPALGSCCEWISRVQFNTIDNSTDNEPGYADYTGQSTTVQNGQSFTIEVDVTTNSEYLEHVQIFFDWNRDYEFESIVYLGEQQFNGTNTYSGTIDIPADAPDGCSLMRVYMSYYSTPSGGCDEGFDGEVEDYTIVVNSTSAPTADFTASAVEECPENTIQFNNETTIDDNSQIDYLWDFGDGTTSTEENPEKSYASDGSYTVTLTASTFCSSDQSSQTIEINPTPDAPDIVLSEDEHLCPGESVTLTSNSTDDFTWSTGATSASIEVSSAGTYSYTAVNSFGCEKMSNEVVIEVHDNPAPVIDPAGPLQICEGETITLTSSEEHQYNWNTGETTQSIDVSTAGDYKLVSTNEYGCESSSSVAVSVTTIEPPAEASIIAPEDITANSEIGSCAASISNLGTPDVSQNCSIESITNDVPSSFPIGSTVVTWTVVDNLGRSATDIQTVTIEDNELPGITAPDNISIQLDDDNCSVSVTLGTPVTSDNCSVGDVSNNAPEEFSRGVTEVIWTVTDAAGNVATATQTVEIIDNIAPQVQVPEDVIISTDVNDCIASNVTLDPPNASDNCTIASITNDAPDVFEKGENLVSWTISDEAGNKTKVEQKVIVEDMVAPQIEAPQDLNRGTSDGLCEATSLELGSPEVSDNCSLEFLSNDAPDSFPIGETMVSWTAVDQNGNSSTAVQKVTISDHQAPVPETEGLPTLTGECSITIQNIPKAMDNCSGLVDATTESSLEIDTQGTHEILWEFEDEYGNLSEQIQLVHIEDNTPPEILTTYDDIEVCNGSIVPYSFPEAVDNCTAVSMEHKSGLLPGSVFPLGETEVAFKFSDENGNESEISFIVTVHPRPAIDIATTLASCDLATGTAQLTITDGQAPYTEDWAGADNEALFAGNYEVEVTDANGCESSAEFEIQNPENPSLEVQTTDVTCFGEPTGSAELNIFGGTPEYSVDWNGMDPNNLENGDYEVRVTDAANCQAVADFTIEEPNELLISGDISHEIGGASNGSIEISINGGVPEYSYLWDNGATTEDLEQVAAGYYVLTVTDGHQCVEEKLFVVDNTTSVSENSFQNLSIYPNPVVDEVNISITTSNSNANFEILDLRGKVIAKRNIPNVGNNTVKVDLSELAEGVYLLKLVDGQNKHIERLMKGTR